MNNLLSSKFQPFVEKHVVSGVVTLVATKDQVLDVTAVGHSDLASNRPMQGDDVFWIASITKAITGTLFMMLVDEGKVALDEPVEKYIPEFKELKVVDTDKTLHAPGHAITMREILSHTSGMPFIVDVESPTLDLHPLSDLVKHYAQAPLTFDPGTQYAYSNAGINTAGRIIETVSGISYEEFLNERLLRPLEMNDTTFRPDAGQLRRLVKPYKSNADKTGLEEVPNEQMRYPLDDPSRQPLPAGGLYSTAPDLAKFCQMILHGGNFRGRRYISEASIREMTRKHTPDGLTDYGLGWSNTPQGDFSHGGAYATHMNLSKDGLIAIFLVQQAGSWPNDEGTSMTAILQEEGRRLAGLKTDDVRTISTVGTGRPTS